MTLSDETTFAHLEGKETSTLWDAVSDLDMLDFASGIIQ